MSHAIFSLVNAIPRLTDKHGKGAVLEGLEINGRLVMVYSKEGLNDVANAKGCCCCGGNKRVVAVYVGFIANVQANAIRPARTGTKTSDRKFCKQTIAISIKSRRSESPSRFISGVAFMVTVQVPTKRRR